MSVDAFLDRLFSHLPQSSERFAFSSWKHDGRPTNEGVGILMVRDVDIDAMVAAIMDVDHYVGNVEHVVESRSIEDSRFVPPAAVRFYQKINVPLLADIQHELVLVDKGERDGWRVIGWYMLEPETEALDKKKGARSEYNDGAWLIKSDRVAYALSSAPKKSDVGRLKFAALTKGADAGAARIVESSIEGMVAWSRKHG